MDETFYCECCCEDINTIYLASHPKFCELTRDLATQEIDELLNEMGFNGA